MDTIKNFIVDLLNGFSFSQIPFFIFQLLAAGFLAYLLQKVIAKKKLQTESYNSSLISISIALLVVLVKIYQPFAILGAAIILLMHKRTDNHKETLFGLFIPAIIGVGCGVGSVIFTAIGTLVLITITLIIPFENKNNVK